MTFAEIDARLERAIHEKVCSAAQLHVSRQGQTLHRTALGVTQYGAAGQPIDATSLFDLASLTKPLATVSAVARLVESGRLQLDTPVEYYLATWRHGRKARARIHHLLRHTSGLADWRPFFDRLDDTDDPRGRLFTLAGDETLLAPPGQRSLYSDLDFILLGTIIEEVSGERLDRFCARELYAPLGIDDLFFLPIGEAESDTRLNGRSVAATEICPRRGLLCGQVHDDNAHAAGGVCGHAGLFGTAAAVDALLREWRRALRGESELFSQATAQAFVYPLDNAPGAPFVLGWDRPTWKTSQAGRFISPHAVGHLGFTGTSCWYDMDRDIAVTLLTNRVHPSREETRIGELRRDLHEAIYTAFGATAPGPYRQPPSPDATKNIHLVGIAGTGMGSLAGMLKQAGYAVSGSDEAVYPPMSDFLREQAIDIKQPFSPANLDPPPDLTIIGNVCTRDHIEAVTVQRRALACDSFPGALERLFLASRRPLVVAGTHGKTTTCALLAWCLEGLGRDPGFMIGGLLGNFDSNFKLGNGPEFVVEGDEYDSAYFDKYPKFLHYRPFGAIVTSLEYDHADIYDSVEEIEAQFARFATLVPAEGRLVACWDHERVRRAAAHAPCPVIGYGDHPDALYKAERLDENTDGQRLRILRAGQELLTFRLPMSGRHNALNTLAVVALLNELGHDIARLPEVLARFAGIARRQQVRGTIAGVRVIDDFAHHPTAIATTLDGLRSRYPKGRLLAAFDPRTNTTSRNVFQARLAACFEAADVVVIGDPSRPERIPPAERLDVERLVADLAAGGKTARHLSDPDAMADFLVGEAAPGDTLAVLSNGGFGGLHEKVLQKLQASTHSG